jgi:hypothetical protein
MNIFVLSEDPQQAAQMHCDKHVLKMIIESGQMLCAAHPPEQSPWKITHYNHPCTVWARTTSANYNWLADLGLSLCSEYRARYKKTHKSEIIIQWCKNNIPPSVPEGPRTPFVIAIKDPLYHRANAVESYRSYYLGDKVRFAKWKYSNPPDWWIT